jgi:recombination associated protein RdgC
MFFKNLQVYQLPAPWVMDRETLQEKLQAQLFRLCPSNEMQSRGWRAPRGNELVYSCNRNWLLALDSEQRLLPASVVNQLTKDRAEEIERQQGFAPGRKQMRELKDLVTQELLPRAFTRRSTTWVWVDPVNGWLGVDTATQARAEDALELLRRCLGDLPLHLINTQISPASAMTAWLAEGEGPDGFTVDRDCELKDPGAGAPVVRYVRHALDGDDVPRHVAAGKVPTRLAMTWNDRLSFVLTDRLGLKRLHFLDIVRENTPDAASAEEQFDSDWTLFTGELQQFLPDLLQALGGKLDCK